ncbi:MAG TPA: hypothetical protein VLH35_02240, partial [Candidatus Acidoferrales bacterium]|nr:hypothetical protein [Candidatus Acidoferrales bacterium]
MKLVFWLLDINPKVNDGKVDIWLWGIDESGNRVLLIDHNFSAYFYAVLHGSADGELIAQQIMLRFPALVANAEVVA